MNNIKIIKLPLERWEEYRDLRLEALKNAPTAFEASPEEYTDKKDDYWYKKLKNYQRQEEIILFAEDNGQLIGIVGVDFNSQIKRKHAVTIVGTYVKPKYQGQGIASMLVEAILKEIGHKPGVVKIDLDVNTENPAGIKLYEKFGFKIVGTYQKELYVNGKYYDYFEMEKLL